MEPIQPSAHALVPEGGRAVIFRALPGLGDFLCVTPALRALRSHRPDVEVTWIGLPEQAALVARYPHYVDRFVPFPGFPGLPERRPDIAAIPRFLREAQAEHFDLAIQLHGSGVVSNLVVELLGAGRRAGHAPQGAELPDRGTFRPWVESCSEVRRSLRLMAHLGWPSDDERLEFTVDTAVRPPALDAPYAVVHPGASSASRRWAASGFRDVAAALMADGLRVVLTGTVAEMPRNRRIAAELPEPAIDLTGRTTLDELAATIRGAALLVANDTGVSHLAVALGTPSVIVFTASDRARWAPLDASRHVPAPGSARRIIAEARRMLAGRGALHAA